MFDVQKRHSFKPQKVWQFIKKCSDKNFNYVRVSIQNNFFPQVSGLYKFLKIFSLQTLSKLSSNEKSTIILIYHWTVVRMRSIGFSWLLVKRSEEIISCLNSPSILQSHYWCCNTTRYIWHWLYIYVYMQRFVVAAFPALFTFGIATSDRRIPLLSRLSTKLIL